MSDLPTGSPLEHLITCPFTCSYSSLNERTTQSQAVWVIFHGIGYLSRYFLRHFTHLDPREHYILAPQAPSLYYLSDSYTHVGASWLTREETQRNMDNLLRFLDGLWEAENLGQAHRLVLFGYSQGVSVLCRWVARRKIPASRLVLYAGKVPEELTANDFAHLPPETKVEIHYGNRDPYLEKWDRHKMEQQALRLFGDRLHWRPYEGGHELLQEIISG